MRTEKGVIIAAYKQERNPRFIVLKRQKNWEGWELPKGHLEDAEEETVRQELKEEAGIDGNEIESIRRLDQAVEWSYEDDGEEVERKYSGFLVKVDENAIVDVGGNPHEEHSQGFFFRERDAKSLLTYDEQVELLERAVEEIEG
ncbi:MAG: NUDIX domain-containing protein [Candidatus Nanohaloarchaea archaeon]